MPTNEQRRATAKKKLERQLERRAQQARRRRLMTRAGVAIAAVLVVAIAGYSVWYANHEKDKKASASATSSTTTTTSTTEPGAPEAPTSVPALPAFKPPANLGANCEYPDSPEPATKQAKRPRTGKVPTDPATVSASMVTDQGKIGLLLDNGKSPCTVNSFASLAQQGFFNDTQCHRLTTSPSLAVLQCGDPKGDGTGGPGYQFANEYPTDQYPPDDPALHSPVVYPRGTLAMANAGPGTNSSQFFLVYKDSQLPPEYTVFGKIQDDGLATLDKIAKAGVAGGGDDGAPATPVTIKSVLLD